MKQIYSAWVHSHNRTGSNKASSYLRALELLEPILARKGSMAFQAGVWVDASPSRIQDLYLYVLEEQRKSEAGIFGGEEPASYWRNRYYSAALKSLLEFLVMHPHEQAMEAITLDATADAATLSKRLSDYKISGLDPLRAIGGEDVIRKTKTRLRQNVFRNMVLENYQSRCAVTGLPIPEVLRASHISEWSKDKKNRLNPENGLCLSATYDAAFDKYLISFDEDLRLILSPQLNQYLSNASYQEYFAKKAGQKIELPVRFRPDQGLLAEHRKKLA